MKLTELKTNQAIGVETKGVIEIQEGDFVLVGIKCVYSNGQFIPTSHEDNRTKNKRSYWCRSQRTY